MTKDQYLAVWRSVNDLQAQAGPERFERIMTMIEDVTAGQESFVPYKTRSWTAQAV
jgi:hypothetical protein